MLASATTDDKARQIAKKGKDNNPSPFLVVKTVIRLALPYLVLPSSFFSIPVSFAGSPAFCSPPAGAAASGAGAGVGSAGAGAGGGGGGGSSFLPHPAKVRVKAKNVINDNEIIFLPILRFTSFPVTHLANLFWLSLLYCTSLSDFQGQRQNYPSPPHHELRLGSRRILSLDDSWTITALKYDWPTAKKVIAIFSYGITKWIFHHLGQWFCAVAHLFAAIRRQGK
jgi:hypothetical protein